MPLAMLMTGIIAIRLSHGKSRQIFVAELIGVTVMTRSTNWSLRSRLRGEHPKHDERLLKDAGLSAEQAFGPSRAFWFEWRRVREPWQL
jgi:uncharacterized protein YjiS (DUF1127 family)